MRELRLRDGDEVALGNSRLVFHWASGGPGEDPTTSAGVTVVASAQSMPAFLATVRADGVGRVPARPTS